jgi:hypothetical protein
LFKPLARTAEVKTVTGTSFGGHLETPVVPPRTECPHCGAALAREALWCSLCFADLSRTDFDPLTAPLDEVMARAPEPVEPLASDPSEDGPGAPATSLTSTAFSTSPASTAPVGSPDTDPTLPPVEGLEVMFALLSAEHRGADPSTRWLDLFSDGGPRMAVMIGGTLAVTAVCFAVIALLGLFV